MERQSKYITLNYSKIRDRFAVDSFDNDNLSSTEDIALFDRISDYMKARLDQEEVKNDPDFQEMDKAVEIMISDYKTKNTRSKSDEDFIKTSLFESEPDDAILSEISNIKKEIDSTKIDDISAEWVMEWHEKKQNKVMSDARSRERKSFITESLQAESSEEVMQGESKKVSNKSFKKYIFLAAAAAIGIFITINSLIPSYDTDKLFNTYYQPYNAVSPVTRGDNSIDGNYVSALENYKSGNYQSAAAGFLTLINRDSSIIAPRYYLGVTELALGNYNKAIDLLKAISYSGQFEKESQWYLGLAYLKTGSKQESVRSFKKLSASKGYYAERSEEILRRLK